MRAVDLTIAKKKTGSEKKRKINQGKNIIERCEKNSAQNKEK